MVKAKTALRKFPVVPSSLILGGVVQPYLIFLRFSDERK